MNTNEFKISASSSQLLKSLNKLEMFYMSGFPWIHNQSDEKLKLSPTGVAKARILYGINPQTDSFNIVDATEMIVVPVDEAFTIHAAVRIDGHLYTMPLDMLTLADFKLK